MYQLESFAFLNEVSPRLRNLALGETRSRKPSLAPLGRFERLDTVYVEGQHKDIEVLSQLHELEDVTLRSITTRGLDYLKRLDKLRSLDIKLGGIRDLSAICGMPKINYLEVWQVRGLSDVSVIADLPCLQNLFLQSLPNVQSLPSLSDAHGLRGVVLMNMRGLRDFTPLEFAPALEQFALVEGRKNEPQDLAPVLRSRSLQRVQRLFGSLRKNREFERMRDEAGLGPFEWTDIAEYRQ